MKRTGFNEYIYDFSVDYEVTDVDDIKDIHKYLMKKITVYIKIFRFVQKVFFIGLIILSNVINANFPLKCISMKNQECKTRPQVINVNSNNPKFYPLVLK